LSERHFSFSDPVSFKTLARNSSIVFLTAENAEGRGKNLASILIQCFFFPQYINDIRALKVGFGVSDK
jgi:hypothetical protein